MRRSLVLAMAGALTVGLSTLAALPAGAATTFVADQESTDPPGSSLITTVTGDLGFSFTPSDDWLGGIELEISCCLSGASGTVRLDVHEGSIAGPIVGTSEVTLLDAANPIIAGNGTIEAEMFPFVPAVSLTPGTLYVVEIVLTAGGDVTVSRTPGDSHAGGTFYFNGSPAAQDGVFRTGRFVPDPKLYWAEAGLLEVQRSNFDGTDHEAIATVGNPPNGVAVDPINAFVYWIECCGIANSRIVRAEADGGGEVVIATGATFAFPERILVDPENQYLFFTDSAEGTIKRANTDGSGLTTLVGPSGGHRPIALALDPVGDKVYWTEDFNGVVGIHRMNLDGSVQEPIVTTNVNAPHGLAIDADDFSMYWTDLGLDEIRRADLDGTNVQVLADSMSHGLQNPTGIAVDPNAAKLYWGDSTRDAITQANLDGTGDVDIVTTGLAFPRGIDLVPVPEPGWLAGMAAGAGLLCVLRRRESR